MDELKKAPDRVAALERIAEYEKNGKFDQDIEENPPWEPLNPDKIDILKRNPFNALKSHIATFLGWRFFEKSMKKKLWILKGATGLENIKGYKGGAMVTCNHFSYFDSYAVLKVMRAEYGKFRLRRIVREGNYSFKGLVGYLMRHGDTIPVGEGHKLISKASKAITTLLRQDKKIIIYPEQAMWWNYRKPRPLKKGAYLFAVKANAPVIPCFITMNDSDIIGADGFPVQEYTVNILPMIYPDQSLSTGANCEMMKEKNFGLWKECYETTYGIPLTYES